MAGLPIRLIYSRFDGRPPDVAPHAFLIRREEAFACMMFFHDELAESPRERLPGGLRFHFDEYRQFAAVLQRVLEEFPQ